MMPPFPWVKISCYTNHWLFYLCRANFLCIVLISPYTWSNQPKFCLKPRFEPKSLRLKAVKLPLWYTPAAKHAACSCYSNF